MTRRKHGPATPDQFGQGFCDLSGSYSTDGEGHYTELTGRYAKSVHDENCSWVIEFLSEWNVWTSLYVECRYSLGYAIAKMRAGFPYLPPNMEHAHRRLRNTLTQEVIPWEALSE